MLPRRWICPTLVMMVALLPSDRVRAAAGTVAHQPRLADFGLVGGDRILWAYQRRVGKDRLKLLRFAYRESQESTAGRRFDLLPQPAVEGRVALAAARGQSLHVFYNEGTHHRYVPAQPIPQSRNEATRFVELKLPDSGLPLLLAADEGDDVILALVTAREAARIEEIRQRLEFHRKARAQKRRGFPSQQNATTEAGPEETGKPAKSEEDSSRPTAQRVPAGAALALVRYEQGRWVRDRFAPEGLDESSNLACMTARAGVIHLFFEAPDDSGLLLHTFSTAPEDEWVEPAALPLAGDTVVRAQGWWEHGPVLLVSERGRGDAEVRLIRSSNDEWSTGPVLVDDSGKEAVFDESTVFDLFGSKVAGARVTEEGRLEVALWSLEDGLLVEPFAEVRRLAPPPVLPIPSWLSYLLEFLVLGAAFGTVFFWRRDSVVRPAKLIEGQMITTLTRRVGAFLIDTIILAPLWLLVLYGLLRLNSGGLSLMEHLQAGGMGRSPIIACFQPLFGVIFAAYGMGFEAALQATPGKRIVRCYVVREGGGRSTFGPIAVRNLLRIAEFAFPPVLLLVLLTRNRQRFGDILARTLVVEDVRRAPRSGTGTTPDETDRGSD
jgi:uncharacterized RDD family membrane protein YckC